MTLAADAATACETIPRTLPRHEIGFMCCFNCLGFEVVNIVDYKNYKKN